MSSTSVRPSDIWGKAPMVLMVPEEDGAGDNSLSSLLQQSASSQVLMAPSALTSHLMLGSSMGGFMSSLPTSPGVSSPLLTSLIGKSWCDPELIGVNTNVKGKRMDDGDKYDEDDDAMTRDTRLSSLAIEDAFISHLIHSFQIENLESLVELFQVNLCIKCNRMSFSFIREHGDGISECCHAPKIINETSTIQASNSNSKSKPIDQDDSDKDSAMVSDSILVPAQFETVVLNEKIKRASKKRSTRQPVVLDLDKHCGVLTMPNNAPCMRSLTCKSHSIIAKRAILGRSRPYDELLARQRQERIASLANSGSMSGVDSKSLSRDLDAKKDLSAGNFDNLASNRLSTDVNRQSQLLREVSMDNIRPEKYQSNSFVKYPFRSADIYDPLVESIRKTKRQYLSINLPKISMPFTTFGKSTLCSSIAQGIQACVSRSSNRRVMTSNMFLQPSPKSGVSVQDATQSIGIPVPEIKSLHESNISDKSPASISISEKRQSSHKSSSDENTTMHSMPDIVF
jgi:hypothetical protein